MGYRVPWGWGDILAGVLGMAWAVATFFAIPIVIYEKLSPLKAIKRSVEIVKNLWKETLILKLGFGALFFILELFGVLAILAEVMGAGITFVPNGGWKQEIMGEVTYGEFMVTNPLVLIGGLAVAIAYWIALGCVNFAAKGVLRGALYAYSKKGQVEPESGKFLGEEKGVLCTHCGAKIPIPAAFCPQCGARLG